MTLIADESDIRRLWMECRGDEKASVPSKDLVRRVLGRNGAHISTSEFDHLFPSGLREVDYRRFADILINAFGGPDLRLDRAFAVLDVESHGRVPTTRLLAVAQRFSTDHDLCAAFIADLDQDGDDWVDRTDFSALWPKDQPRSARRYCAAPVPHARDARAPISAPAAPSGTSPAFPAPGDARRPAAVSSISPLQMQIGFFRLLQGAAYRSFRPNYSANCETHLRAHDLPYTIPDFGRFVSCAVDYYLSLGIVQDEVCRAEFRRLDSLVSTEILELQERIENWTKLVKTPAMMRAEARVEEERAARSDVGQFFADIIEFILAAALDGHDPATLDPAALAMSELNRLRQHELHRELTRASASHEPHDDDKDFLETWHQVIVDAADTSVDGAIMPTKFWYEAFMPQLLRCASIRTAADLAALDAEGEADLDRWHVEVMAAGALDRFGNDVRDGFPNCSRDQKQSVRLAWRLTEHYLNGVEKRREREEFGRETGFLSEYVAFIDVWLGRNDIAKSDMRLSFPYFLGPATWSFLHTSAEIVDAMPDAPRASAIDAFKDFFRFLATMYPCPYCRFHLNRYVARNRELGVYPLEYLFLGPKKDGKDLVVTLDDKLDCISAENPGSLRVFLWKLHNAVSASIARTEPWFHSDPKPFYTTRFWPGLEAELVLAHALGQTVVDRDRLQELYGVMKAVSRLAVLRDEFVTATDENDKALLDRVYKRSDEAIADLVDAVEATRYLSRHYMYDPDKALDPPHFTAEEEDYARSGFFVER